MALIAMKFTEVEVTQVDALVEDDQVVFEQKMDGTRVIATVTQDGVTFTQAGGKPLAHSAAVQHLGPIRDALWPMASSTGDLIVVDGELLIRTGDYHVFDLPEMVHRDLGVVRYGLPLWERRKALEVLAARHFTGPVTITRQARTSTEKRSMYEAAQAAGVEGIMAKQVTGGYEPGVRVKHTVKLKFVKTADVVVMIVDRPDPKHGSFTFGVMGSSGLVEIGKCSAIGKPDAKVGDVIEVAYLYREPESGGLVQPRMMRIRDDKAAADCTFDQFPAYSRQVV